MAYGAGAKSGVEGSVLGQIGLELRLPELSSEYARI
jgi:hypothetical protein